MSRPVKRGVKIDEGWGSKNRLCWSGERKKRAPFVREISNGVSGKGTSVTARFQLPFTCIHTHMQHPQPGGEPLPVRKAGREGGITEHIKPSEMLSWTTAAFVVSPIAHTRDSLHSQSWAETAAQPEKHSAEPQRDQYQSGWKDRERVSETGC